MRCSTLSTLMMAALIGEAVAGPTHAHFHRRAHQKKDVDWEKLDWANMGIDWKHAYANGKATPSSASPSATPSALAKVDAATPANAPAVETPKVVTPSKADDNADDSKPAQTNNDHTHQSHHSEDVSLLNGLIGASNNRKSFGSPTFPTGSLGDNYKGNVGSPYGSNIIKVDSTSGYDFTNTFVNTASKPMVINIWNKVGPNGEILSGSALAPKNTTLTFVLQPGQSQIVAFQDDTQTAWAEVCNEYAASGAYATVWGEAQFRKEGSGFNYSAIMSKGSNNYEMTISAKENSCISSHTQNFWLTATKPIGDSDGSCYVPDSTMHLTTKMGGVRS